MESVMSENEDRPENAPENGKVTELKAAPDNGAASAESELEKAKKELLYLRADFDNFRKRVLREQETAIKFGNERLVKEFVPVADSFEKAVAVGRVLAARPELANDLRPLVAGLEATVNELTQVFARNGAELVGAVGDVFDPARHEALTQQPVEKDLVGKVVGVAQKGCVLHGRTVKPAQVVVGVDGGSTN